MTFDPRGCVAFELLELPPAGIGQGSHHGNHDGDDQMRRMESILQFGPDVLLDAPDDGDGEPALGVARHPHPDCRGADAFDPQVLEGLWRGPLLSTAEVLDGHLGAGRNHCTTSIQPCSPEMTGPPAPIGFDDGTSPQAARARMAIPSSTARSGTWRP